MGAQARGSTTKLSHPQPHTAQRLQAWAKHSRAGGSDHLLFRTVLCLGLYMSIWSLVFPGSWRVPGFMPWFASLDIPEAPINKEVLGRFNPYPSIRFLHVLPSGIWSVLAPIQLASATGRLPIARPYHALLGRLFLVAGLLTMMGYGAMEYHGVGLSHYLVGRLGMRAIAVWFLATAAGAWRSALRRDFVAHRAWVVRHLASGGWVIVQRLLIAFGQALPALGLARFDTWEKREFGFNAAAAISMVLCLAVAEVHAWRLRRGQGQGQGQQGQQAAQLQQQRAKGE